MKLGQLKEIEGVMGKILQAELPIRMAFSLTEVVEQMDSKLKSLEDFRIKLVTKHGEKDEKDGIMVPEDKIEQFNTEFGELLDSDIDIKPVELDIETLEGLDFKVTVRELSALVRAGFLKMNN